MTDDSVRERARANASGIAAVVVTGTWLAMLMLDFASELWLAVMLFGYIAIVPIVSMLFDEEEEDAEITHERQSTQRNSESAETDGNDALERLRRRYAEGELTDEQFERKLERLLETETLDDVDTHVTSSRPPEQRVDDRGSRDHSVERE